MSHLSNFRSVSLSLDKDCKLDERTLPRSTINVRKNTVKETGDLYLTIYFYVSATDTTQSLFRYFSRLGSVFGFFIPTLSIDFHSPSVGESTKAVGEYLSTREIPHHIKDSYIHLINPGKLYYDHESRTVLNDEIGEHLGYETYMRGELLSLMPLTYSQGPDFTKVIRSGRFSDFVIIVAGWRFSVHKIILARNCSYFDELFDNGDEKEFRLNFEQLDSALFRTFLYYLYGVPIVLFPDEEDTFNLLELMILFDVTSFNFERFFKDCVVCENVKDRYKSLFQKIYPNITAVPEALKEKGRYFGM